MNVNSFRFRYVLFITLILGSAFFSCVRAGIRDGLSYLSVSNDVEEGLEGKIICISDLHLTDAKSHNEGYHDIERNIPDLIDFLTNKVVGDKNVIELVICGDILDGWRYPPDVAPSVKSPGFSEEPNFLNFSDIAFNKYNREITDRLKEIVKIGRIKVTYTQGNHDNMCSREIIRKIIPGIEFAYVYKPYHGKLVIEHGHRFDIFNANNNVSGVFCVLPLGYFITRQHTIQKVKDSLSGSGSETELDGSPAVADVYKRMQSKQELELDVLGKGMVDFPMLIYIGACTLFNPNSTGYNMGSDFIIPTCLVMRQYEFTDDKWENIKDKDVVCGWWDSYKYSIDTKDFHKLVAMQYFENEKLTDKEIPKVVVCGHTHTAMGYKHKGTGSLYLNSGTWIDKKKGGCNYVEIAVYPDKFVGSVFTYNGNGASPKKIFSDTVKR